MKGRERNRPTSACPLYYLCFVFLFYFLSFSFSSLSYFLSTQFFFRVLPLFFRPLLWVQWRSSYSACRDQILLFCPLTTFVWSGCTCRPQLVRLHHPPQLQTKKKLFYLLVCRGALSCHGVSVFSL